MRDDTQCDVSPWQFYKAKKIALKKIRGTVKEQYNMLWNYCEELRRKNLRSNVIMKCNADGLGNPKFKRMYVCLVACKKGFLAVCRPIIGLDGCHIKGLHQGHLLTGD